MSDASTRLLALPEKQTSTDDERLAFIADTITRLSDLADQHPIIVHLLSMVQEEANHVRKMSKTGASGGVSSSAGG